MNPGLLILGGAGLGAGLMFMFDPDRGRRRRALVRDQVAHTARVLGDASSKTARDLSHHIYGVVAESSHLLRHEEVSDDVLVARVRARLGRSVSHPHAISVTAKDGHVTLSGPVLAHEAGRLLSSTSKVRGVREVENRLEIHQQADNVPGLQGGRPRTGDRFPLMQSCWTPTARLLTGLAGGALMGNCLARRDPVSIALGTVGFGLFMRSATNREIKSLLGVGKDSRPIEVQKTINIHAPVERVYEFWTNYQDFPRFMTNVREVRPTGNGRSHWIVAGPAGVPVEWAAEITETVANKTLAWKSLPGSVVSHSGAVHFDSNPDGSTRVHIQLFYQPMAGTFGHALAKLFGADPKREMDSDLMRMKTLIETGHPPRDAANPLPVGQEAPLSRTTTA
jgi:uncharacterized membrane protein